MIVEGFESSVLGLFVCYFFPQIFLITVSFQETLTKPAKPQVLETTSSWAGNDLGGD